MLNDAQLAELRTIPADNGAANRVSAAMKMVGATQEDLEAATGLTQPYISGIVNGRYSKLPLETARKFAFYFGCQIEDLFPAQVAA